MQFATFSLLTLRHYTVHYATTFSSTLAFAAARWNSQWRRPPSKAAFSPPLTTPHCSLVSGLSTLPFGRPTRACLLWWGCGSSLGHRGSINCRTMVALLPPAAKLPEQECRLFNLSTLGRHFSCCSLQDPHMHLQIPRNARYYTFKSMWVALREFL